MLFIRVSQFIYFFHYLKLVLNEYRVSNVVLSVREKGATQKKTRSIATTASTSIGKKLVFFTWKVSSLNPIANGNKYLSFRADLNASSHLLFNSRIGNRKHLWFRFRLNEKRNKKKEWIEKTKQTCWNPVLGKSIGACIAPRNVCCCFFHNSAAYLYLYFTASFFIHF